MTETTDASDELVVERRDRVLVLRLNRPEARNALNPALLEGIGAAVLAAESDADMGAGDPDATAAFGRLFAGQVAVPIVGAANATAVAGGLELLLGCDVIVASSAAKFGLPEVKRGLFPAGGGTLLGARIPLGVALELTLTGDSVDAER